MVLHDQATDRNKNSGILRKGQKSIVDPEAQQVGKTYIIRAFGKSAFESFIEIRLYLIVGGMPSVVVRYLDTNNLQEVARAQRAILALYRRDIAKYDPENKLYLRCHI